MNASVVRRSAAPDGEIIGITFLSTGSKVFTIQMMRYLEMFGINEDGFLIKIVKNKQTSGNKALGFELV